MSKVSNAGPAFPFQMVGQDGNAFAIMGGFKKEARRAGWEDDQIEAVLDEARTGDYDHLVATIIAHTTEQG